MASRLTGRIRHSDPQLKFFPPEKLGRVKRGLSLEASTAISTYTIDQLRNNQLLEEINKLEQECQNIHLENLLYSRYLHRVNSSKVVDTYDEYEDESVVLLSETNAPKTQTTVRGKLPEIARRLSTMKKNSSQSIPLWSKLATNWRDCVYASFLSRVEQEKMPIAAYELEQTKLDWDRMKTNASLVLDHLDTLLRTVEFDEIAQEAHNSDFEENFNPFRYRIGQGKLQQSPSNVSAELIISRINKQINARISLISLLHINSNQMHLRMRAIDTTIVALKDQREKMDEIDINFVRTRQIDYADTFEELDRKYKLEKASFHPLVRRLGKWKAVLSEREQEKIDCEYQCHLLDQHLRKTHEEIESIANENRMIVDENVTLRNQMADVKEVPKVTDYAYVIHRTKTLEQQIDIWTKRVTIVETLFSQMKKQRKSPNVLSPLKSTQSLPLPAE